MEAVVEVNNLKAYYRAFLYGVDREVRAVDDVSLRIGRGEIYGVAGESSSGKTTLIKTIAGAIRPPLRVVSGSVKFHFNSGTQDIYAMAPEQRAALRWRHLSYIMQGSMNVLNPVRRIRHSFTDFAFRHMKVDRAAFFDRVGAHLQRLKLDADLLNAYPHELSGGMRQRMTIREIQREMGSSFLFVTHDMGVHAAVSDRIGIVYAGRLVEEAPTRKLFHLPLHPYTQHLVASLPRIGDLSTRPSLEGRPPNLAMPPEGCRFHPRCPKRMDICSREAPPMVNVEPDRRVACFAVTGA
jgi:peptide/nickel transport system ATP-binding protein